MYNSLILCLLLTNTVQKKELKVVEDTSDNVIDTLELN